jgi:antitoxin (DNA-binding transcriptional repressor) of toxin-antitoxin stability system
MDIQPHSPAKTINAGKARVNFGRMLDEVFYQGDHFIIERDGRPMAAVIPLSQLEALQKHLGPAKTDSDTSKRNKRRSRKG